MISPHVATTLRRKILSRLVLPVSLLALGLPWYFLNSWTQALVWDYAMLSAAGMLVIAMFSLRKKRRTPQSPPTKRKPNKVFLIAFLVLIWPASLPFVLPWILASSRAQALAWNYAVISAAILAITLYGHFRKPIDLKKRAPDFMAEVMKKGFIGIQSGVVRARHILVHLVGTLILVAAWPLVLITLAAQTILAKRNSEIGTIQSRRSAIMELFPLHISLLGTGLLVALSTSALFDFGLIEIHTGLFVHWILFISATCWGFAALVSPGTLIGDMKTSEGNPYIHYLLIGISLSGTFVICFTAMEQPGRWLDISSLIETSREISSFKDALKRSGNISGIGLARISSAAIVYLIFLKGILNLKQFEREQEDYMKLARDWAIAGDSERAFKYLKHGMNVDLQSLATHSLVFLGLGRVEAAVSKMHTACGLAKDGGKTTLGPYSELINAAVLVSKPSVQLEVFREWLKAEADDAEVNILLPSLIVRQGKNEIQEILSENGGKSGYPLAWSWLLLTGERPGETEPSTAEKEEGLALLENLHENQGLSGLVSAIYRIIIHTEESRQDIADELVRSLTLRVDEIATNDRRLLAFQALSLLKTWAKAENSEIHLSLLPLISDLDKQLPRDDMARLYVESTRAALRLLS